MRYWFTTHWPHRKLDPPEVHSGVWVANDKRHVIDRVRPDDMVFIYESRSGRTQVQQLANGKLRRNPCLRGREGVVGLVRVTDLAHERENSVPEQYSDGTRIWWRWHAPTESTNSAGFIPRRLAARLLGYSEEYVFRGYGEARSGLSEISHPVFERLLAPFVDHARATEQAIAVGLSAMRGGPGGEGPMHSALKHRIAADPAGVLGEPGLRLWAVERALPTGDRVDVILKDIYDRFVAVEVEPACSATEEAGPLQCMKYRSMLSYAFDRPLEEIRTMLVAHSIHPSIAEKCVRHRIEPIAVYA